MTTRTITLTQGKEALIDADDFDLVSQFKWSAVQYSARHGFYAVTNMHTPKGRRSIRMHRFLVGAKEGEVVDHINGDPLDNRRANLRICTQHENIMNSKQHRAAVSKFKGVTPQPRCHDRWRAQIQHNGKKMCLGSFGSQEDAATVYNFVAIQLFGEFARVNEMPQPWLEGAA